MNEKPFNVSWALKKAREAVDELEKHYDHLAKVANTTTGKIMPVEKCNGIFNASTISYHTSSRGYITPSVETACKNALAEYSEKIAVDRATHEKNKAAIENNIQLKKNVALMMANMGLPESYSAYEWNKRRTKRIEERHSAGWATDMNRFCVVADQIEDCERRYKELVASVEKYRAEKLAEEAKKKAEQEKIAAEKIRANELAVLIVKYGMDVNATCDDVLDKILSKNKYLRLAHFLLMNRNDWDDGPDYAETGISGFEVETETDKLIADEINGLISDWDNDGRVFRDCEYNYYVIFGMVGNEELLKDYEKAKERVNAY